MPFLCWLNDYKSLSLLYRFLKTMMEQENTPNKSFNRREFLKRFHAAATVTCASTWVGCTSAQKNAEIQTSSSQSKKKGEMTYRITPNTGDKVSLLGYIRKLELSTKKG